MRQHDFIATAISAGRCHCRSDLPGIVHCSGHRGGNVEFHHDAGRDDRVALSLPGKIRWHDRGPGCDA